MHETFQGWAIPASCEGKTSLGVTDQAWDWEYSGTLHKDLAFVCLPMSRGMQMPFLAQFVHCDALQGISNSSLINGPHDCITSPARIEATAALEARGTARGYYSS